MKIQNVIGSLVLATLPMLSFAQTDLIESFKPLYGTYELVNTSYDLSSGYLHPRTIEDLLTLSEDRTELITFKKMQDEAYRVGTPNAFKFIEYKIPQTTADTLARNQKLCLQKVEIGSPHDKKVYLEGFQSVFSINQYDVSNENFNSGRLANQQEVTPGYYRSQSFATMGGHVSMLTDKDGGTYASTALHWNEDSMPTSLILNPYKNPKHAMHVVCEYKKVK